MWPFGRRNRAGNPGDIEQARQKAAALAWEEALNLSPEQQQKAREDWHRQVKAWLLRPVTAEELQGLQVEGLFERRWLRKPPTVPECFGPELKAAWAARYGDEPYEDPYYRDLWILITELQRGGELWHFSSSRRSWKSLAGRQGYAVVRDGEVVETLVTMVS